MKVAMDPESSFRARQTALNGLSTEQEREEVFTHRARNENLYVSGSGGRIAAAKNIADARIKDEILLEIINSRGILIAPHDLEAAIQGLSSQGKREEVWIDRTRNSSLGTNDGITAARRISNANPILKSKALIGLYNSVIHEEGAPLQKIINAILDQEMQDLARQALAGGDPIQLRAPKSARKI
jgi:hypothetical protein